MLFCPWWKSPPKEDELELGLISRDKTKKFTARTSSQVILCVMMVFILCDMFFQMALIAGTQKVDQKKVVGGFTIYDAAFHAVFPAEKEFKAFSMQVTYRITRILWDFVLILLPYFRITSPNTVHNSITQFGKGIAAILWCTLLFIILEVQCFQIDADYTVRFLTPAAPIEYFLVVAFIVYVFKTDFVDYDPFVFHDDYRPSCHLQSRSELGIITSTPYEIEIRNYTDRLFIADAVRIEREVTFHHGKNNNHKVAFYLPQGMRIGAGETVRLIPESEHPEEDTVSIQGFRCFGFSSGNEIRTDIINHFTQSIAQKRELNKHLRPDLQHQRKTLVTSNLIWTQTKMVAFDDDGHVQEVKRRHHTYPDAGRRFRPGRICVVVWEENKLKMAVMKRDESA